MTGYMVLVLVFSPIPAFGFGPDAEVIERGRVVFMEHCVLCHGLKYYRSEEAPTGITPLMSPEDAVASFGVAPPDLTLIAKARGRGKKGANYIYRLLTTYYADSSGNIKNLAFAEWTHGDGTIAMPQPIAADDPLLKEKARDVSLFLHHVAEPSEKERKTLGVFVVGYMAVMTALLYALNRKTWRRMPSAED